MPHKTQGVGLQNTNSTCYINSFIHTSFLTDASVWCQLEAESQAIQIFKIDEEDFELKILLVNFENLDSLAELLQKQFAKMALTTHKHADILDILQDSQQTIAQVSSRTCILLLA